MPPVGFLCRGQYGSKTEKEISLKSILTDVTKTAIGLEIPLQCPWARKKKKGGGKIIMGIICNYMIEYLHLKIIFSSIC